MTAWLTPPIGSPALRVTALNAHLPVLETERLILRPCKIEDWATLETIWTTDRAKYIGGPMNGEDAWLDFNQSVASWLLRGTGPLTITLKDDETPLGLVLIAPEYGDPSTELCWLLTGAAEGNGYATEAARALRDWGFTELGPNGFCSFIYKDNAASLRVAARLGATRQGDHPEHTDCAVFAYTTGAPQ
ncbi:GNAT family N-acetyltransferase [Cognatiyoonia sp.]|uniref:GNAT family N-acetyltransferase n=1 Tax=Cognatiyoonia sp. TaxID=2211652 RepID=UPI003F6970DC